MAAPAIPTSKPTPLWRAGIGKEDAVDSQYFLFDGRWFNDPDSALVLCTADTIAEALDDYTMFPQDTVIVDARGVAVYCEDAKLDLTRSAQ